MHRKNVIATSLYTLLTALFYWMVRLYSRTFRVTFIQNGVEVSTPDSLQIHNSIITFWHDSLIIIPIIIKNCIHKEHHLYIMISKSRDGDIPSQCTEYYKNVHSLRVAHNNKSQALFESITYLKRGDSVLITPDGPRGPRRVLKNGALIASFFSQRPIIPISAHFHTAFHLSSWDKFSLPLPFSRVTLKIGTPVYTHSKDEIAHNEQLINQAL